MADVNGLMFVMPIPCGMTKFYDFLRACTVWYYIIVNVTLPRRGMYSSLCGQYHVMCYKFFKFSRSDACLDVWVTQRSLDATDTRLLQAFFNTM